MEKELPSTGEVVLVQAMGGVIAGASSSIATTPMDTIKTRLQVGVTSLTSLGLRDLLFVKHSERFYDLVLTGFDC